jgi:hypothetical protein
LHRPIKFAIFFQNLPSNFVITFLNIQLQSRETTWLNYCRSKEQYFLQCLNINNKSAWSVGADLQAKLQKLEAFKRCGLVTGSIPDDSHSIFKVTKSFQLHHGPGVDTASNRNEYQESS